MFLVFIGLLMPLTSLYGQFTDHQAKSLLRKALKTVDSHSDSTVLYAEKAFQIFSYQDNHWGMAKSLELSGYARKNQELSGEAVANYFEALYWLSKSDTIDFYMPYNITRNIAAIQRLYKNYDQAEQYYDSSLYFLNRHLETYPKIAKKYRDSDLRYTVLYYKASSLREQGRLEESSAILSRISDEAEAPKSIALKALINYGLVSRDLENYSMAEKFFSMTIERAVKDTLAIWRGQHGLALMKYQQKQYKEAIPLYQKAIQTIRPFSQSGEHLFISYLDLGESYFMLGEHKESAKYLNKALSSWSSDRIDREPDFYAIYELLARVYLHIEPEQADQWIVKYAHSSEQFIAIQQRLKEENARRALDAAVKNRMDSLAHQEEEKATARQNIYYGLAIMVVMALIGYLYHKISLKRKDEKLWDDSVKILENQD